MVAAMKGLTNTDIKDYVTEFWVSRSMRPRRRSERSTRPSGTGPWGSKGDARWQGAGPVVARKIMPLRVVDFELEKNFVEQVLTLKEKSWEWH